MIRVIEMTPIRSARSAVVLALCLAGGCGKDVSDVDRDALFRPTEPALLSTGSPSRDEDPAVLRARDGSMFVAWFSEQSGTPSIHITRTTRGGEWSAPVRVTTPTGGDFNPHLIQDEAGTFHLTWFRWSAPFRGHIMYNSSGDGLTWSAAGEVQVTTTPDVDDWVPTIARTPQGGLAIFFVSAERTGGTGGSDLWVATRRPGQAGWDAAAPVGAINSAEHDHLPFAANTGDGITLVWERHDLSQPLPWLNTKSTLYYATSPDGVTWSGPERITTDDGAVVNLFPMLYQRRDGAWAVLWLSTRTGQPRVFEIDLERASQFPQSLAENTLLPPGYSHRVAETATPGVYLGVWVQGPDGAQDLYYRFFAR